MAPLPALRSRSTRDLPTPRSWQIDVEKETVQAIKTTCPLCARPKERVLHSATTDHKGTMWIFGGQTYTDPGKKILYLGDLWRVRCRQLDSLSECVDDATYMRHARRHGGLDHVLPEPTMTDTIGGTVYGGGLLWLKLNNFIDTVRAQHTNAKERHRLQGNQPQARASASLSYHKSSNGNRRLILFGGFTGADYLNDLWIWELPDQDDDLNYYRGTEVKNWGTDNVANHDHADDAKGFPSHLSAYYPFRDAVGRWKRLAPPGTRPSARDTHLALTSWSGYMYTILGRAAETFEADSDVVWGFDPSGGANASGMWFNIPRRNNGPAGRMDTCGGIGYGPLGKQLYAFGGWLDRSYGDIYSKKTDELWQFDMSCTPPVVSQVYPSEGQANFQDACPADNPALKPCGFGENAVGSVVPCVGHFDYEAPFADNTNTFLNDFTSRRPSENRLHGYKHAVSISRTENYPPLRGAAAGTVTKDLPHGNPVLSAGLSPVNGSYDMAYLRDLQHYFPMIPSNHEPGTPLIGPEARITYLVENTPGSGDRIHSLGLGFCQTSTDYEVRQLSSEFPDLKRLQSSTDRPETNGWYNDTGVGTGMCNIKDVDKCQELCASVPSCNYFSISLTQPCYACFIYKTCGSPGNGGRSASFASKYEIFELVRVGPSAGEKKSILLGREQQQRRSAAARSARSLSMLRVLDSRRVSLSARDY